MKILRYIRYNPEYVYASYNKSSFERLPSYTIARITEVGDLEAWDSTLKRWCDGRGLSGRDYNSCLLEVCLLAGGDASDV